MFYSIQNGSPCKSDWNLTHDDSAVNNFLLFFWLVMIHVALRPTHCYKLESFLNIILTTKSYELLAGYVNGSVFKQ